jgi:hypothetical protein
MSGRPIKYSEAYIKKTKEYIDLCEDELVQVVSGESEKFTAFKEKVRVKIPTIEGLSLYLKIHKDTIYDWEKKYKPFSDVINILRAKQVDNLINKGLSGDYNPIIAKVLLSKQGYSEKTETNITTQDVDFTF